MNTASGETSRKHSFLMHQEGNQNREGKREEIVVEAEREKERSKHFHRRSAAICHFSYGSLCSLEGFVGCEDFEETCAVLTFGVRAPRCNKWAHSDNDRPWVEKPISPHAVRFSQTIGVCVRKTFPIRCLKWADVGREYIKRLFVLDFNDQAMNRFIEHQMLTTFKEFQADCHRHFKKYSESRLTVKEFPSSANDAHTHLVGKEVSPMQTMPMRISALGEAFPMSYQYGVVKASPRAFLPTFFPTSFCTSGYPFPTYFSFLPTFFGVESTPVSCSEINSQRKD
ncbi:CACTA en-spm transposon protein [Cucumis melo var. makuwa]|uniref:CACTA en-spm transposon protein n=1 Tax=Cucumis melo var. makuwa TaxID=1194695 RepID=A0A5D3BSU8_CUCMM|nr:CACTA en-spm transposon protein [Cucumis melo var. makuwa]